MKTVYTHAVVYCGLVGVCLSLVRRCLDNRVNVRTFTNDIIPRGEFLSLYTIGTRPFYTLTKTKSFFNSSGDTLDLTFVWYANQPSECSGFIGTGYRVVRLREYRSRCRRFNEYAVLYLENQQGSRFFSQAPTKYIWWFICLGGSIRSFDSCEEGFFALFIPDNREGVEIDLSGLPWDKIAEDLEDFTGLKFGDSPVRSRVRYSWVGEECFLNTSNFRLGIRP